MLLATERGMAACVNDQLSASQYISAIPKIIKSGRLADDADVQQPLNAMRYAWNVIEVYSTRERLISWTVVDCSMMA